VEDLSKLLSVELKIKALEEEAFDNLDAWLPSSAVIEKYNSHILSKLV